MRAAADTIGQRRDSANIYVFYTFRHSPDWRGWMTPCKLQWQRLESASYLQLIMWTIDLYFTSFSLLPTCHMSFMLYHSPILNFNSHLKLSLSPPPSKVKLPWVNCHHPNTYPPFSHLVSLSGHDPQTDSQTRPEASSTQYSSAKDIHTTTTTIPVLRLTFPKLDS